MSPRFDDTDDDVSMGSAAAQRSARELDRVPPDHEFTLNTGVVLALFFALALLCAVFFGFGYSIGHKSAPPAAAVISDSATPVGAPVTTIATGSKPSPGTAAVPDYVPPAGSAAAHPPAVPPAPRPAPAQDGPDAAGKPAPIVRTVPPAETAALPAVSPTGTTYVQVAAVSHQEDADILLSALRRRGYTVLTRTDAADHLIHVQLGPFATKKDADAMRQKLQGDGYNAILK